MMRVPAGSCESLPPAEPHCTLDDLHGCTGVTGLLAEADVPLLLRLSVAHRQDGLVPGVNTVSDSSRLAPCLSVMLAFALCAIPVHKA